MIDVFEYVDRFFNSVGRYFTYNGIFLTFISLFLLTILVILISTSHSYEARLIKAVDMFNNHFIDSPQITEDNLVAFNEKMKSKKVPKQLRKQWQQFVLYREDKASSYMSFENCVSNPIKNSSYKRDIKTMNVLAYIFSLVSLVLNLYFTYDTKLVTILQRVFLCPAIILFLNYIITIFLDLRHNAIVSDLYQNYQYFEVNIDKATQTLPEYVDYEVLFDRNEIKRGIPILYAYLQRRAEEEQKELERARLRNVEHEKFNFDDAGVAGSLVLERAMQEAENYIAERKKFNQDTEQINSDITQEETNYREITKEYNRQMQVSKETFANFKAQLDNASSTIEANYLKKQQQQELDRQRNLERDFDTATERHKKILESYQEELDSVDSSRSESRKVLEVAMMNEFSSYSEKVYEEANKLAEQRVKDKLSKAKSDIRALEEKIAVMNEQLKNAYSQDGKPIEFEQPQIQPEYESADDIDEEKDEFVEEQQDFTPQPTTEYKPLSATYYQSSDEDKDEESEPEYDDDYEDFEENQEGQVEEGDNNFSLEDIFSTGEKDESAGVKVSSKRRGRPKKVVQTVASTKKRGRPRKGNGQTSLEVKPTGKRGRPKKFKVESLQQSQEPAKRRGRPKKDNDIGVIEVKPAGKRGRPKKVQEKSEVEKKSKGRGRPKKVQTESLKTTQEPTKKRGRPKKVDGETPIEVKSTGKSGSPQRAQESVEVEKKSKGRGRPKKLKDEISSNNSPIQKSGDTNFDSNDIDDIDAYLKEIDAEIAKENAKMEESKKELEKNTRIRRRRK